MSKKKKKTLNDILKYEIAIDLGLSDKIDESGWGELTTAQTGKIGGIISARKRTRAKEIHKSTLH